MSYGQPGRRITAGPSAGPASASPRFSRPASICFKGPRDVFVPGLIVGRSAALGLAGCATEEPANPSWAAATIIAAAPRTSRRLASFAPEGWILPTAGLRLWEGPAVPQPAGHTSRIIDSDLNEARCSGQSPGMLPAE